MRKYIALLLGSIVAFIMLIFLILFVERYIEHKQFMTLGKYYKSRDNAELCSLKGDSCVRYNSIYDALDFYKSSYEALHTDTMIFKIISCEQILGNTDEALSWLDKLEERAGKNDFTSLRRCSILHQNSDTAKVITILNDIISTPITLRLPSFLRPLYDGWMHSDENYTIRNRYYQFYVDYYVKLLALKYRLRLTVDEEEMYKIGHFLFKLVEDRENDYEIMNEFNAIKLFKSLRCPEIYEILNPSLAGIKHYQLSTLERIGYIELTSDSVVGEVMSCKWNMLDELIIRRHLKYGLESALEYAKEITNDNTSNVESINNYSKFMFGIYLGADNPSLFPSSLTKEEIDDILHKSIDNSTNTIPLAYLTVGFKAKNIDSIIVGDKLFSPIIILGCNDWSWEKDDSISFAEFVYENKSNRKHLRYLDDYFKACVSSTSEEYFGLHVKYLITNKFLLNLYQAEYDKQMLLRSPINKK